MRHLATIHTKTLETLVVQALSVKLSEIELLSRHDETEAISPLWDIPTHLKERLSLDCLALLNRVEQSIENLLSQRYRSASYYYPPEFVCEFWEDARKKISIEAQVMSYLDKLDGFMMAFHELVAGNSEFIVPVKNYINIFREVAVWKRLPLITKLFYIPFEDYKNFLWEFHSPQDIYDWESTYKWFEAFWHIFDISSLILVEKTIDSLVKDGKPHTIKSLYWDDFWLPVYKAWKVGSMRANKPSHFPSQIYTIWEKEMTLEEHLTTQVEFG